MKVHKITLYVIDFDDVGVDAVKEELKNTEYANHCINPLSLSSHTRDIGEWSDDHPLNFFTTRDTELNKLFTS
jgi:hypothetical protein